MAGTACGVGDKELVVGQQQQMGVSTKRGSDGSVAREDADAHGRGVHGQERSAGVSAALPQQQQQQLLWDGEGDSEGEGEAEGNGVLVGAKRGVAAGVRHGSGGGMQINGKLLLPSRKTRVLFLVGPHEGFSRSQGCDMPCPHIPAGNFSGKLLSSCACPRAVLPPKESGPPKFL